MLYDGMRRLDADLRRVKDSNPNSPGLDEKN